MTVRLLGTGGADGIPAVFGDDPVSEWAREHGGREVRTRAAAIVDEGLKIDLPPENARQLLEYGLRACDWDILLFTHSDDDHLALNELQYALHPFTNASELPFSVFGNPTVVDKIRRRYPDWPIDLHRLHSFDSFESAGYRITALKARHTPGEDCLNFLIEREGRRLVYATDTGLWPDETFEALRRTEIHLLVVECTNAAHASEYEGHLDIPKLGTMLDRLREAGAITTGSRVVTTHHAAAGGARYCDLEVSLGAIGVEPGFDGMLLEV